MIFVAEITAAIDAAGTLQTFYISSGEGWTTTPSDTPANTPIAPRLKNPGSYRSEIFSGSRVFGAVKPSYGNVEIFNADGLYDVWKNYGFDGQSFKLLYGNEKSSYPGSFTTVFICTMRSLTLTETSITIELTDNLHLLDVPILKTELLGTGGVQGTEDMTGEMLPRCFGDPGLFPLMLLDGNSLIYACHEESVPSWAQSMVQLYDGGVPLMRGDNYSSVSELLSIPPDIDGAECRFYFDGPTYVRISMPATYDLRLYSGGYTPAGQSLDEAWFLAELGITPSVTGGIPVFYRYIDNASETYLSVFEDMCKYWCSWFAFDRLNQYKSYYFTEPSGNPVYTFTRNNCISITRTTPDFQDNVVYKIIVNSGEVWPCTTAPYATVEIRDYLSRQTVFNTFSSTDNTLLLKHKMANTDVIDLKYRIPNSLSYTIFADKYKSLFGVERDMVVIECPFSTNLTTIDLGDVVSVLTDRFGFNSGKLFRVIGIRYALERMKMEFVLWG